MVKVSVLYPNGETARFDMKYYCDFHVPLARAKFGAALKGVEVDRGLAGATPGSRPAFIAIGHLYFDSVEAFQASFGPHSEALIQDIPNYTNVEPDVQISEVVMPLDLATGR